MTPTLQTYRVGVFSEARDGGRKTQYRAYTLWYNPQWPGCCEHTVRAVSGKEAKALAIEAHKTYCERKEPGTTRPAPPRP